VIVTVIVEKSSQVARRVEGELAPLRDVVGNSEGHWLVHDGARVTTATRKKGKQRSCNRVLRSSRKGGRPEVEKEDGISHACEIRGDGVDRRDCALVH